MATILTRMRIGTLLAAAAMGMACGTDPGTGNNGGGSITISVAPGSLSIQQGGAGSVAATITRSGGFTGAVTIVTEGAPAGVTASVSNVTTSGTTTSGTVDVSVAASVPPATYPLTIRATGTGVDPKTFSLSLIVTAAPTPSFEITSIAPDPRSIAQGASGDVTVTLTRSNFTGAVNLTLEGAPTTVTGTFVPAAATGTTSVLTLAVGPTTPVGNHTLTVRGTGTAVSAKTKTFVLTVTAGAQGGFSIGLGATAVTVPQNAGTVNVPVTINRVTFTGSVALAVAAGLPSGLTATVTPSNTTGNTATLALSATTAVAPATYQLTVLGSATGEPDASSPTLNVAVTAASGGPGNVTLDFSLCEVSRRPHWVAYQDGSGAWTRAVPTGDAFSFSITAGKGGFAAVTGSGSTNAVALFYFSQAELVALPAATFCGGATLGKGVTASVPNLGATDIANLSLGGGVGAATFVQPTANILGVDNGNYDLIGSASNVLGTSPERFLIRRDINTSAFAEGGSIGSPLDFAGSESFAPATATITLNGLAGGQTLLSQSMSYSTGASCTPGTLYTLPGGAGTTFLAYGVPAGRQRATDYHNLRVSAGSASSFRSVFRSFQLLADRSIDLPPALTATVTAEAGPYKILRFQFALPAAQASSASATYRTFSGIASVFISASGGWLGGPAVDLTMPDFSGLPGWSNLWMPTSVSTAEWTVAASGFDGSLGSCADATFLTSGLSGTIP